MIASSVPVISVDVWRADTADAVRAADQERAVAAMKHELRAAAAPDARHKRRSEHRHRAVGHAHIFTHGSPA